MIVIAGYALSAVGYGCTFETQSRAEATDVILYKVAILAREALRN